MCTVMVINSTPRVYLGHIQYEKWLNYDLYHFHLLITSYVKFIVNLVCTASNDMRR